MKHSRLDAILCQVLKKTFLSGGCRVMTQAEADERPLGLNWAPRVSADLKIWSQPNKLSQLSVRLPSGRGTISPWMLLDISQQRWWIKLKATMCFAFTAHQMPSINLWNIIQPRCSDIVGTCRVSDSHVIHITLILLSREGGQGGGTTTRRCGNADW